MQYLDTAWAAAQLGIWAVLGSREMRAIGVFIVVAVAAVVAYTFLANWHLHTCASDPYTAFTSMGSPTCAYVLAVLSGVSGHWVTIWGCAGIGTLAWMGSQLHSVFTPSAKSGSTSSVASHENSSHEIISVLVDQLARWRLAEPRLQFSPPLIELQEQLDQYDTYCADDGGQDKNRASSFLWSRQIHRSETPKYFELDPSREDKIEIEEIFHT